MIQTAGISPRSELIEVLPVFISVIRGKYKTLPTFYGAREQIENSDGATSVKLSVIAKHSKYADEYSSFVESLASLLSGVESVQRKSAKAEILRGMDAYLNVFTPSCRSGVIRQIPASLDEVKGEDGYPFFNNKSAINEWQRMEYFIKESVSKNWANELNQRGESLFRKGDREGALNAFTRTLKVDPDSAMAYNNLGVLSLECGEREKALAYFEKALKIDPDDQSIIMNVIDILRLFGRDEDAREACVTYLKRNPKDEEVVSVLSSMESADSQGSP
jgi:tetratricopeptide (TPR) repeat protein